MIPNENFITNRVLDWSYSNSRGCIEIPIGVFYGSEIESEVLFEIWRKFKESGIEVPFLQGDQHLKTPEWSKISNDEK